jgi:putative membrane protein
VKAGALGLFVLLLPVPAAAHGTEAAIGTAPLAGAIAAGLLATAYVLGAFRYRLRRGGFGALSVPRFAAGLAGAEFLVLVVCPQVEALIGASFARHMAQHMVLLLAAPALLALGRVDLALAGLLPRTGRPPAARLGRLAGRPVLVAHLLLATVWLWHLPGPWLLAERNDLVHLVDHAMLVAASVLYWRAAFERTRAASLRPAATMLASLILIVGTGFLGAVLTLAPVQLYGAGVLLPDQQAGGVLMWVPGGLAYAAVLLWALDRWLVRLADEPVRRSTADVL